MEHLHRGWQTCVPFPSSREGLPGKTKHFGFVSWGWLLDFVIREMWSCLAVCYGQVKRLEVVDEWIETTFKGREIAQDFVNSQPGPKI